MDTFLWSSVTTLCTEFFFSGIQKNLPIKDDLMLQQFTLLFHIESRVRCLHSSQKWWRWQITNRLIGIVYRTWTILTTQHVPGHCIVSYLSSGHKIHQHYATAAKMKKICNDCDAFSWERYQEWQVQDFGSRRLKLSSMHYSGAPKKGVWDFFFWCGTSYSLVVVFCAYSPRHLHPTFLYGGLYKLNRVFRAKWSRILIMTVLKRIEDVLLYWVRGTELIFLLLDRFADPADRRCDRCSNGQTEKKR